MPRIAPLALVALAVLGAAVWAQEGVPLGPEFRVSTFTTGDQAFPTIVSDPNNFDVYWASDNQDGSGRGVYGQRYSTQGVPQGIEFRVNTFTTGGQYIVAASTINPAGDIVVVWNSSVQDGSSHGVYGQRFAGSGAPLGPEFRINTFTTGFQGYAAVADSGANDFMVVWHSAQDGSANGIYGQRFADTGAPLGPEFRINTFTPGEQRFPVVTGAPGNETVVVWTSTGQDGSLEGIFGQTFGATGAPLGPEFRVNGFTSGNQFLADVTILNVTDPNSLTLVTWGSQFQDGSGTGVFGNVIDANNPSAGEFQINTYTTSAQEIPTVAADSSGNFVVSWTSLDQDGSSYGIFAQRYNAAAVKQGGEFRVNTFTTNLQGVSDVATGGSGNFLVVWQSVGQDGSGAGIYGQRYGQIVPVELMRFGVE